VTAIDYEKPPALGAPANPRCFARSSTASIKRLPRLAFLDGEQRWSHPSNGGLFHKEVAANNLSSHFSYHCINIRVKTAWTSCLGSFQARKNRAKSVLLINCFEGVVADFAASLGISRTTSP